MAVTVWDIGECGCEAPPCTLYVQVKGCGSTPLAVSSGLTVNLKQSGSTIYTGTTDSGGLVTIDGAAGTYDIEVVDGRATSRWNTQTFTGRVMACDGTQNVTLTSVKTGFACTYWCGEPIKTTLQVTDVNGTYTLSYSSGVWYCCASVSMAGVVTTIDPTTCAVTTGTGTVNYRIGLSGITNATPTIGVSWGYHSTPGSHPTSSTQTCSGGILDTNANVPPACIGVISPDAAVTPTISKTCPLAFSLSGTLPATGTGTSPCPAAGLITFTE